MNFSDLIKGVSSTEISDTELCHAVAETLFNISMEYKSQQEYKFQQQEQKEDERRERMHEVKCDLKTLQPHHQEWKTIKIH